MARTVLSSVLTLSEDVRLAFEWHGGAYIEVREQGRGPVEVINVMDYVTGKPRIPFTQQALRRRCQDWIGEYGRDSLLHDVTENWYR